jgi:hypothetical protein
MSDALLMAVLDALLPGDATLPPASRAGVDVAKLAAPAQPLLARIDARAFLGADAAGRSDLLRAVAQSNPVAFRECLDRALAAYYQAPTVLAVFGWRSEPPMPQGHELIGDDGPALALLDTVRDRGPLWRR